jgi:hypothetical protein
LSIFRRKIALSLVIILQASNIGATIRKILFGPVPLIMMRGWGCESGRRLFVIAGVEKCLPAKDVSSLLQSNLYKKPKLPPSIQMVVRQGKRPSPGPLPPGEGETVQPENHENQGEGRFSKQGSNLG